MCRLIAIVGSAALLLFVAGPSRAWGAVCDDPASPDPSEAWNTQPQPPGDSDTPDVANEDAMAAQETTAGRPEVSITTAIEEGKKVLVATVMLDGKPIEGAQVAFFVERQFGRLSLGTEETLDDGTAAVSFPAGLPGGSTGELRVVAEIKEPPEYALARGQTNLAGGVVIPPRTESFPRTLWAPKAPLALILTISLLVGGVWCAYAFVFVQLLNIRKGAKS